MPDVGLIDKSGLRRDALRNIGQLLRATGDLLRSNPSEASMQNIAEKANVSPATAYRYFPTLQHLHTEFLYSILVAVRDFSFGSQARGTQLFEAVCLNWVETLEMYGPALTQIRSTQGFLERLDVDDSVATVIRDTWERPVREVLRELGISEKHTRHCLFLSNTLLDSREIGDLLQTEGLTRKQLAFLLSEAFYGAARGWSQAAAQIFVNVEHEKVFLDSPTPDGT